MLCRRDWRMGKGWDAGMKLLAKCWLNCRLNSRLDQDPAANACSRLPLFCS